MSDQTWEIPPPAAAGRDPDPTTPVPVVSAQLRPSQVALVFVAVAAATFILGIAIGIATNAASSPEGTVVAVADVDGTRRIIRFDGGHLVFPEGAVGETIRVIVRRSTVDERLRMQTEDDPLVVEGGELAAYHFEPTDITFEEPVEITFRLPERAGNGSIFVHRSGSIILLSGTVDPDRATVTIRVRDFRFGDR